SFHCCQFIHCRAKNHSQYVCFLADDMINAMTARFVLFYLFPSTDERMKFFKSLLSGFFRCLLPFSPINCSEIMETVPAVHCFYCFNHILFPLFFKLMYYQLNYITCTIL